MDRFTGLGPEWFWEDELTVPGPPETWVSANAQAVAEKRREMGWTHEKLAEHFGKSPPTIRAALKLAVQRDPSLATPRKMAQPRWTETHYADVAALRQSGMTVAELSQHFGKSDCWIRAALRLAREKEAEGRK